MKIKCLTDFNATHNDGFTLTELVVVIVTCLILGSLLLPALAGTKPNSAVFQCLQNQQQLIRAWQMYAEDNNSILVASTDQPGGSGYYDQRPDWMKGNIISSPGNWDPTVYVEKSPLFPYFKNPAVVKCPADPSTVNINGTVLPRVRSVSMNQVFDSGQWLPANQFRTYGKLTDIVKPANTFVFIDENPTYMNDAAFAVQCDPPDIVDFPATYHNNAAGISFADGHATLHQWTGPICLTGGVTISFSAADDNDWSYLANNTTVLR